jgi:hypothetical protein
MSRIYTREEVLAAITGDDPRYLKNGKRMGSAGIVSTIADRLGCAWHTARKQIDKWESTKRAFDDEGERVLDLAESKMMVAINEGDGRMIRYILSTKGKARGYTERQEITGADGGPLQTHQVALTPEEETAAMDAFYHRVLAEVGERHTSGDQPVEEVRT